jgi:hypothetical protein
MGRCRETLRRETGVGAYHRRTGTPKRVRLKKLDDAHRQERSPPKLAKAVNNALQKLSEFSWSVLTNFSPTEKPMSA